MDITPNGTRLALSEHGAKLISLKQECIPVGCVPPTSVAVVGEGVVDTPRQTLPWADTPWANTPLPHCMLIYTPCPLHAGIHPIMLLLRAVITYLLDSFNVQRTLSQFPHISFSNKYKDIEY